jgi:hypothetical protein
VPAVRLGPVADILRPLSEYLRAFRAFDFHFFVDHENGPLNLSTGQPAFHKFKVLLQD